MDQTGRYRVTENDDDKRVDRVLRQMLPDVPLGALSRALRVGLVRVNGSRCAHDTRLHVGDILEIRQLEQTQQWQPGKVVLLDKEHEHRVLSKRRSAPADRPARRSPERTPEATPDAAIVAGRPLIRAGIIWRDRDLLVVNKPAGIEVHGPDSLGEAVLRVASRER